MVFSSLLAMWLAASTALAQEPGSEPEPAPQPTEGVNAPAVPENDDDPDDTDPPLDGPEPSDHDTDAARRAELVRLSLEMKRRAAKDHWDGVEHAYRDALATSETLSFDDHMFGVNAAFARGDVAAARERLLGAKSVRDDSREVIETLWSVDTSFARVRLRAPEGTELAIDAMPFNPQEAKAIGFARASLERESSFDGYLPKGTYTLGERTFEVEVREIGAEPMIVDVREHPDKRRREK